MISRRSSRALAELIEASFRTYHRAERNPYHSINSKKLYDFLYDHGYAAWFCNSAKAVPGAYDTQQLKEFVMQLHTGESLSIVTPNWAWDQRELLGQRYLADLARDLLEHWKSGPPQYDNNNIETLLPNLSRSLELDGYKWDGKSLVPNEAEVLDTAEESGVVRTLFRGLALADEETTFHHLKLTEDHYLAGRWDDSIANSRKFLESVLAQVAARHASSTRTPVADDVLTRPARVRDYLAGAGLLEEKEKQAVASVYGLLSETGGHPYMAKQEEARLMRHLSLTFAQFVMLRLRSALTPRG